MSERKLSEFKEYKNLIDVNFAENLDETLIRKYELEDNQRMLKDSLLNVKTRSKKQKKKKDLWNIYIVPLSFIILNFIWFYLIDLTIGNSDFSVNDGLGCSNLLKTMIVVREFYFWITIFLILSFCYDVLISNYNKTLEYIGSLLKIVVQCFNYIGLFYFVFRVSYSYSFYEQCNMLSTLVYIWLSFYYFGIIIGIIIIIINFIDALNFDKENKIE